MERANGLLVGQDSRGFEVRAYNIVGVDYGFRDKSAFVLWSQNDNGQWCADEVPKELLPVVKAALNEELGKLGRR